MENIQNRQDYVEFLSNPEFVKWGIVISCLVWKKSFQDIANAFNITKPYISKVKKRFLEDKGIADGRANNGGHNKKLFTPEKTRLQELVQQDRSLTARKLANQISMELEQSVSTTTVTETLKNIGYKCIKPLEIPYLSESNKKKRYEYCTSHKNNKFSNVCFMDEAVFQLFENRQLVWWCPSAEEKPVLEYPATQSKVMVCGGISKKGLTNLYFWDLTKETVDALGYTECLDEILIPRMNELYGRGRWRLVHDNARIHSAYHTQDFLRDNDIRTVDHPPYSPDLNPIEKVWGYLKKKVMTKVYSNIREVIEAIEKEWDEIPLEHIENYIDGHTAKISRIFEEKGNFIVE